MSKYRSAVARCSCLAADRFEIAFATKEGCKAMSSPTDADMRAVRRLRRFLRGLPRVVQEVPFTDFTPSVVRAYVDSDWAGCRKSLKSTSGGVLFFGDTAVRGWAASQAVIALNTGEGGVLRRTQRSEHGLGHAINGA